MVPVVEFPPRTPFTFHSTAVALVFRTVALNWRVWPIAGVAEVGTTATLTCPLSGSATAWSGCLPRGAHGVPQAAASIATPARNLFLVWVIASSSLRNPAASRWRLLQ
jgi:hypothetical protein